MQRVTVTIEGKSPLLMNAFPMMGIEGLEKKPPEEQAEAATYRTPDKDKRLYIPALNVQRALVGAGAYSKGKGRASLQKVVAATLFVTPEYLLLEPQTYVIDSRRVVINATRGGIMRHRPRFDQWTVGFTLDWDDTLLSATQVRKLVDDMGQLVGLLDFRPATRGPFGRCQVTHWTKS